MSNKFFLLPLLICCSTILLAQNNQIIVPLGGNAFSNHSKTNTITKNGIERWTNPEEYFTVYFRVCKVGKIDVCIEGEPKIEGEATLEFSINNQAKKIYFTENKKSQSFFNGRIGEWKIKDTGYVVLTIKGVCKSTDQFPSFAALKISGTAIDEKTSYVKDNEGNFFYWGRRGPSVHLSYQMPEKVEAEWFYNEVTVPKGNDVIGSYFMANGFGEGYFGIQVNSAIERRVLFSVWSPFKTDNPKEIPEDHKILMLKKGADVHTGEFGNEGSGGQSYLKYNWKAGNTYKFLLHASPSADNYTTYTAYFYAPELNKWQLIASFKRPQTQTYIKRPHSFLENFIPEMGDKERIVQFKNQWICDVKGNWQPLSYATFTIDDTGKKNYRKDYAGGLLEGGYYLKNGGFFGEYTTPNRAFFSPPVIRPDSNIVDISKLP